MVVQQQCELLTQVHGKQVGARQRGFVTTGSGHKAVAQPFGFQAVGWCPAGGGLQPHKGVASADFVDHRLARNVPAHGVAQVVQALVINGLNPRQGGFGVVKNFGGDEWIRSLHAPIVHIPRSGSGCSYILRRY